MDEASNYFRTRIPEAFADKLARRAETVFAHQPFWQRKLSYRRSQTAATNREFILMFMRHWLAGVLERENPVLFRQLPESFKIGKPLPSSVLRPPSPIRWAKDKPEEPRSSGRESAPSSQSRFTSAATIARIGRRNFRPRYVHGCELLPA